MSQISRALIYVSLILKAKEKVARLKIGVFLRFWLRVDMSHSRSLPKFQLPIPFRCRVIEDRANIVNQRGDFVGKTAMDHNFRNSGATETFYGSIDSSGSALSNSHTTFGHNCSRKTVKGDFSKKWLFQKSSFSQN
jgi:hypothetical protein